MTDGFIKVAAGIPQLSLANVAENTENIKNIILRADESGVNLLVLPELCITGSTCGDLFFNSTLISAAKKALVELTEFTNGKYPVVVVGLPLQYNSNLYNCAAVLHNGAILGIVPKDKLTYEEKRYFTSKNNLAESCIINLTSNICAHLMSDEYCFANIQTGNYAFGVKIVDDLFSPTAKDSALYGAAIIASPASLKQTVGSAAAVSRKISAISEQLSCGCVLASSGLGESTTDAVFGGQALIAEGGKILAENKPFGGCDLLISEIDVASLSGEQQKNKNNAEDKFLCKILFEQEPRETEITQKVSKTPFLPEGADIDTCAEEILQIQSNALARRISHTHCKTAVIGISGGLDSTLALLVAARAMKILNRPACDILAVTMPCFGTTSRTRSNSEILCNELGTSFKEINITAAVKQHFKDIGHSESSYDITYENSQARERTQVLMDIANQENGLVIGTGDLSELALGWATYNGDHMSMYGVNAGVPKTLIRHIVRYEAENSADGLKSVLFDILDTPVSPELLPADTRGEITQKTEDLVGPYELHDFFLYYMLHSGASPKKIFRLASSAFPEYEKATILKWLKVFTRRFFAQQFKRSCMPDGPQVLDISLSPRGGLKMPTDAFSTLWLDELEEIEA